MPLKFLRRLIVGLGLGAALLGLSGCATPPPADDPDAVADYEEANDPLEPTNRVIFAFNLKLDKYVLDPASDGYRAIVPPFGRARVSDFLANIQTPTIFANDLLQANFTRASYTLGRFVLNSTFGVGGLMDVATPMGLPRHDNSFGTTLAVWGVPEGPYLMLPLFMSSNPRDVTGLVVDSLTDPLDRYLEYNDMTWVTYVQFGLTGVSRWDGVRDQLADVQRTSLDYYAAMRSLSRQQRAAQIASTLHESGEPSAFFVRMLPHIQLNLF